MPKEQSVKFRGMVVMHIAECMRTAFDNSQRDFLSFFMHDQKVHSFKIASALFSPIASVCPRSMKSPVNIIVRR